MVKVYHRAGSASLQDARDLALYNARKLGGVWWVWTHPHTGQFHVTDQALVEGTIIARTAYGHDGEKPVLIQYEG